MIEELKNILKGKTTLIKSNQYFSAADYINPFLKRLEPLNPESYKCQVKIPDQLSITNGNYDIVYNRVHIQAILPESYYYKNNCKKVVGMIYGLDVKNPVAKFYIADIDQLGNTFAFDSQCLSVQELESETALNYNPIKTLLERTDNNAVMIQQLKNVTVDRDKMSKLLGEWIDFTLDNSFVNESGKIKLASSTPIDVYKSIIKDKDSDFYVSEDKQISLFDIYQCFINQIRLDDKDIMNRFEKTMLVNKLLKL